jgi:hypothetical protein
MEIHKEITKFVVASLLILSVSSGKALLQRSLRTRLTWCSQCHRRLITMDLRHSSVNLGEETCLETARTD